MKTLTRWISIPIDSRIQYLYLVLITILALSLRIYKLGAWSFWIDEVFTMRATRNLSEWPLARLPINLVMIRSALELYGISEWSARLVPALVGTLTIPALYFPIRRIMGTSVALLSMLLLTLSPWHIFWSQSARFYTLLLLFYTLGMLLFYIGYEEARNYIVVIAIIFLLLAVRERIFSFFFIPVIAAYILFRSTPGRVNASSQNKNALLNHMAPRFLTLGMKRIIPIAIISLPVLLIGLSDLLRVIVWGQPSYFDAFFSIFFVTPNITPFRLAMAIIYRLGLLIVLFGLAGGIYLLSQRDKKALFFLTAAMVPPALLVIMSGFMFTVDRYIFFTLPFWLVLAAVAFQTLFRNLTGPATILSLGVLAVLIFSYASEDVLYFGPYQGQRADWRTAFHQVGSLKEQTDLVSSTRPEMGLHYLGENTRNINTLDPEEISQAEQRVWFVIDEDSGWVKPGLYDWILTHARLVDIVAVYIPGKSYSIRIYLYDPADGRSLPKQTSETPFPILTDPENP